jgi:hypothetical protein
MTNICFTGSGRKALVEANGIRVLYESAQDVIDCREMEGLILLASVIMRKCCPRNKLPLGNIRSVVKYELPESELYPPEGLGKFYRIFIFNYCSILLEINWSCFSSAYLRNKAQH